MNRHLLLMVAAVALTVAGWILHPSAGLAVFGLSYAGAWYLLAPSDT